MPSNLAFGDQQVGTKSAPQTLTFTNTSKLALTVTPAVSTNYSEVDTCTGFGYRLAAAPA
jgi:hypothetical protein